jgi:hypothetical protein
LSIATLLAVRRRDDYEQRGDRDADRDGVRERTGTSQNEDEEDLFGRVRGRRQRVRREDGQRLDLAQPLLGEARRGQWRADEQALESTPKTAGDGPRHFGHLGGADGPFDVAALEAALARPGEAGVAASRLGAVVDLGLALGVELRRTARDRATVAAVRSGSGRGLLR